MTTIRPVSTMGAESAQKALRLRGLLRQSWARERIRLDSSHSSRVGDSLWDLIVIIPGYDQGVVYAEMNIGGGSGRIISRNKAQRPKSVAYAEIAAIQPMADRWVKQLKTGLLLHMFKKLREKKTSKNSKLRHFFYSKAQGKFLKNSRFPATEGKSFVV